MKSMETEHTFSAWAAGVQPYLKRLLPAPLTVAGLLLAAWLLGAWSHANRAQWLPEVSGPKMTLAQLRAETDRVPAAQNATPVYREILKGLVLQKALQGVSEEQEPVDGEVRSFISSKGSFADWDYLFKQADNLFNGEDAGNPKTLAWLDGEMRGIAPQLGRLLAATELPRATGEWYFTHNSQSAWQGFSNHAEWMTYRLLELEGRLALRRGDFARAERMLLGMLALAAQLREGYELGGQTTPAIIFTGSLPLLEEVLSGQRLTVAALDLYEAAYARAFGTPHRASQAFRRIYESQDFDRMGGGGRMYGYGGWYWSQFPLWSYPYSSEWPVDPWYCLVGEAARRRLLTARHAAWWSEKTRDKSKWSELGVEYDRFLSRGGGGATMWDESVTYYLPEAGNKFWQVAVACQMAQRAIQLKRAGLLQGQLPEKLKDLQELQNPSIRADRFKYSLPLRYARVGNGFVLEHIPPRFESQKYGNWWYTRSLQMVVQPEPPAPTLINYE